MFAKIASFMFTLALIGWEVFDVVKGHAGTLTWVLLVLFSLCGLFELGDILHTRKQASAGTKA